MFMAHVVSAGNIYCQQLKVESLSELPNDLTARTKHVSDANNRDCALIKISCMDEITNLEGNVILSIDKGLEYWVYMCEGSKYLKIHTRHHPVLEINLSEYMTERIKGNVVYKLDLKTELSPEILFGTSNAIDPITMEKKGTSLFPDWWNSQEDNHYVGISIPSYDGEAAKYSALVNAVSLYAAKQGMTVRYRAIYDRSSSHSYSNLLITQELRAIIDSFSVHLLQEYYNYEGTYFVLCKIEPDNKSSNIYERKWEFYDDGDEERVGAITNQIKVRISIKRQPIELLSLYRCRWDKDNLHYSDTINNLSLCNSTKTLKECNNDFMKMSHEPIGFLQTKILSSLPSLPEFVSIKGREITDDDNTWGAFEILGQGQMRRMEIEHILDDAKEVRMSIAEQFPDNYNIGNSNVNHDFNDIGISNAYFNMNSFQILKESGYHSSPLWEIAKNNALVLAMKSVAPKIKTAKNLSVTDEEFRRFYESYEKLSDTQPIEIYPLWYMDRKLRNYNYKKGFKDQWKSVNEKLNNSVSIFVPLDGQYFSQE